MRIRSAVAFIAVFCTCSLQAKEPVAAVPKVAEKVVVLNFDGPLRESPGEVSFSFEMKQRRSLYDVIDKLKQAGKDKSVRAVLLTFDSPQLGWAQMQELRQAVLDFKAADKPVYSYIEAVGAGTYLLASAASHVAIAPVGEIQMVGIRMETPYFKALMDKIGVEADLEHLGDYKGAGEPFTRTEPSDAVKAMNEWLIQGIFDQFIDTVAESRNLSVEQARATIDKGPFTAKQAKAAGLVDEIAYVEDFVGSLRKRFGDEIAFDRNYGGKKTPDLDFSNVFSLFKSFGELMAEAKRAVKSKNIAIVYVDGMIVAGKTEHSPFGEGGGQVGGTSIRRVLNKLTKDEDTLAVVLRVDSPGGSAMASDIMWHAVKELNVRKPVVVSMGNIAASGGYYISAGAPTIFADAGTITGSIGVIGGKVVTKGLWDWVGVSFHATQRGRNADLDSNKQRYTDEQRAVVRAHMQQTYDEFKDRITQGRGQRLKKPLDDIAGGRVYTGKQALELGLVDKLGGLNDALTLAAEKAHVADYTVKQYPEPKNFFEMFVKSLTGELDEEGEIAIRSSALAGWTTQSPAIHELLPMLSKVDPTGVAMVLRSLMRIELLAQEGILLALPTEYQIK